MLHGLNIRCISLGFASGKTFWGPYASGVRHAHFLQPVYTAFATNMRSNGIWL